MVRRAHPSRVGPPSPPRHTDGSARSWGRPSMTTGSPRIPAASTPARPSVIPSSGSPAIGELYELAGAVPRRHRALVLTAGLTGLRQGELFALRWSDVDLLHATINVHRKRLRLASGAVIEDDPKSDAGRRRVALPAPLVGELQRHLEQFGLESADGYVFTSPGGLPLERSNFRAAHLGSRHTRGRPRRAPVPRPPAYRRHTRSANRSHDEGTDGPPRPYQPAARRWCTSTRPRIATE